MRAIVAAFVLLASSAAAAEPECPKGEKLIVWDCFDYTICDRDLTGTECWLDEARTVPNPAHTDSATVFIRVCGKPKDRDRACEAKVGE